MSAKEKVEALVDHPLTLKLLGWLMSPERVRVRMERRMLRRRARQERRRARRD